MQAKTKPLIDEIKQHIVDDGRDEAESYSIIYDMYLEGTWEVADGEIEVVEFISPEDFVSLTYGIRQARTSDQSPIVADPTRLDTDSVISRWKESNGVMRWTKPTVTRDEWLEQVKAALKVGDPLIVSFEDTRASVFSLSGELSYGYVDQIKFDLGTISARMRLCHPGEKTLVLPKGYRKQLAEYLGKELSRGFHDSFNKAVSELQDMGYQLN